MDEQVYQHSNQQSPLRMEVGSSRNGDGGSSSGSFMSVINGGIFNVNIINHESYLVI
jgi:hypothetical protein